MSVGDDVMRFGPMCPICQNLVELHAPGISYTKYEGEWYHVSCAKEAIADYDEWSESTSATYREAVSIGHVIAEWITARDDYQKADEIARRMGHKVAATLFLKEVLGKSAQGIASPRRVR